MPFYQEFCTQGEICGLEKKTKGIAKGPRIAPTIAQNIVLAFLCLATA